MASLRRECLPPRGKLVWLALLAALFVPTGPACAADKKTDIDDLMSMSIDELNSLVVTARRRPEQLQKVPMSITRLDGEMLRELQIERLGDLRGVVPNLVAHEGDASNAVVYQRGIGQLDSLFFSDPGVGVYLDDVYLGCPQCANLNLFDLERVEVLRGPQGTLYGKNTIAGAIKYISKAPSDKSEAGLEVVAGNYDRRAVKGVVGGSLAEDRLLGRLAFVSDRREGFARNALNDKDDYDKNDFAYRGSLKWLASRDVNFQLTVDGVRKNPSSSRTPARATSVLNAAGTAYAKSADPLKIDANYSDRDRTDSFGVTGTLSWDIDAQWSLKSITAYRETDYDAALDIDGTRERILDVWYQLKQRQLSQEVKLNYAADKLNTVFGIYFYRDFSSAYDGVNMSDFMPAAWSFAGTASTYSQRTFSYAAYGEGSYQWSDRLSLTAGVRYTFERKKFSRNYQIFTLGDLPQPGSGIPFHAGAFPGGTGPYSMDKSWASLSPKLGATYQWNDSTMTYASASSGFKSGGFDGRAHFLPGALNKPYDPENVVSYEIGLKTAQLNNRLIVNASLFHNRYRNIQLSTIIGDQGLFQPVFINAGKGITQGAEIEFTAKPPVRGLTVRGSLGYLRSQYKEFLGQRGAETGVNIADQRHFANAPTWTAMLGAVYQFPLGQAGTVRLGGDLRHAKSIYPTVSSSSVLYQGDATTLNAFVSYESSSKHWLVTLAGKNLNNARVRQHGFDAGSPPAGYQVAYYGDPRVVHLSIFYRF